MDTAPTWLLEFAADVHSQNGEDGIIQKILEVIPDKDKWCVEFGAWDGEHLSNTCNLIDNHGYSAVLIEGSKARFRDLQRRYASNRNVVALNSFVGFSEDDNLDVILESTPIPRNFDFLSIDIDGNDYHAWESIREYEPKAICIEFNPTTPTEVEFVQAADHDLNQGSSLLSLVKLGKRKGYELVSVLPFNAFFVRSEYFPLFHVTDNRPDTLRADLSYVSYLFSGYDGTVFVEGSRRLPWHNLKFQQSRVQQLPAVFRRYPDNFGKVRRLLYKAYRVYRNHITLRR